MSTASFSIPNVDDVTAIIVAVITTAGVIIGGYFASRQIRNRRNLPEVDPPVVPATPLSMFSGTQNDFMALVVADNAELRESMETIKRELGDRVTKVENEQKAERAAAARYREAVRRWLEKILKAWPGPGQMPGPDTDDVEVLGETMPRHWTR